MSSTKPDINQSAGGIRLDMRPAIGGLLALALIACDGLSGTAPGAVSEGEAAELDEIAEQLDERKLPPEAIPEIRDAETVPAEVAGDTP